MNNVDQMALRLRKSCQTARHVLRRESQRLHTLAEQLHEILLDNALALAMYRNGRIPITRGTHGLERVDHPDRIKLYERQGGQCRWCGRAIDLADTIDHIVPRSAGGTHCINNLQLMHDICNSRHKHTRRMSEAPFEPGRSDTGCAFRAPCVDCEYEGTYEEV